MQLVHEAMALVAASLLSACITVFVLAVSLLGDALEKAKLAREEQELEWRKRLSGRIEEIQKDLERAKDKGSWRLVRHAIALKRAQLERRIAARRALRSYRMLHVNGSVLAPGLFFLLSIALSLTAVLVIREIGQEAAGQVWSIGLGSASFVFLFLGMQQLLGALRVIQRTALSIHPEIDLDWTEEGQSPTFPEDTDVVLEYALTLTGRGIVKGVEVTFFLPQGFKFVNAPSEPWLQKDKDFAYYDHLTMHYSIGSVRALVKEPRDLKLHTPESPGTYEIGYRIRSEHLVGELRSIKVRIEEVS